MRPIFSTHCEGGDRWSVKKIVAASAARVRVRLRFVIKERKRRMKKKLQVRNEIQQKNVKKCKISTHIERFAQNNMRLLNFRTKSNELEKKNKIIMQRSGSLVFGRHNVHYLRTSLKKISHRILHKIYALIANFILHGLASATVVLALHSTGGGCFVILNTIHE